MRILEIRTYKIEQQRNQQPHTQPAHIVNQAMIPSNNAEIALSDYPC